LASCLSRRLVGHVDDQYDVSTYLPTCSVVPGCLEPEVQECRRSRRTPSMLSTSTESLPAIKNPNRWSRCQQKHVHQDKPLPRTPKSLGILPKKGISSYYQYQSTCSNCKRDCEVQISPEKALESDELRDDVEISRRRRLLVVSIDSSSLLFKTWSLGATQATPNGVVSYYSLR
jgi:hypothetical protein